MTPDSCDVLREHLVKGNGAVDILAKKPGQTVSIEVETGRSNTEENLSKIKTKVLIELCCSLRHLWPQ